MLRTVVIGLEGGCMDGWMGQGREGDFVRMHLYIT